MAINVAGKNAMLDELATLATHMSLHSGYPATSANELSGGTPAYARVSITWKAAAGGEIEASNKPLFNVPPGKTVSAVGFWSAATAGTQYGDYDVVDEVFAGQGSYTVTSATIDLNK